MTSWTLRRYGAPVWIDNVQWSSKTVGAGDTDLVPGAIVGIQTADGKAYWADPNASDGTETVAGVVHGHPAGGKVQVNYRDVRWLKPDLRTKDGLSGADQDTLIAKLGTDVNVQVGE